MVKKTNQEPKQEEKKEPISEITPEEQTEEKLDRVEQLLEGLVPGHRISIYRIRPAWCRSWLETIELADNEGVDMDYLARTWGGEILRLKILDQHGKYKGQAEVPLMSYPPKVYGKVLSRNMIDSDFVTEQRPQSQAPQASQRAENTLATIIDVLSKTRKDDLSVLKTLLPSAAQETRRPLAELLELGETFNRLKEIFATDTPPPAATLPTDSDAAFLGSIAEMVKTVFAPKSQPQPRIIAPGRRSPNPESLASIIAAMSPDTAANTFFTALRAMSPQNAEAVIKKVFQTIQNNDINDNDIEDEDEDENENENESGEDSE